MSIGRIALCSVKGIVKIIEKEVTGNGYIDLTDAIIDKLLELKAYGGCNQASTPIPSTPVDIVCNNGALKVSPNLFNISKLNIGTSPSDTVSYKAYSVPNGTYTMSTPNFPTGSNTANIFFLAGNVSSGASSASNGVLQNNPITITVSNGYYTVGYRSGLSNPNNPKDYSWQIEKGSTATSYTPYGQIYTDGTVETIGVNGGTVTCENLLGVGDYKDVQEILSGSVTRNVGIKVLDGTETWQVYTVTQGTLFRTQIEDSASSGKDALGVLCNCYNIVSAIQRGDGTLSGSATNYDFINDNYTTLNDWTAYLANQYAAGTPVIVVYPLATPTQETVTGQTLSIPSGDSRIEIATGSILNLPLYAKYKGTSQ